MTFALLFHPAVTDWFQRSFGAPTAVQAATWPAIKSGRHVLIAAPTGSGKTLATFLAASMGWCGRVWKTAVSQTKLRLFTCRRSRRCRTTSRKISQTVLILNPDAARNK
jgi:hypothetical protein